MDNLQTTATGLDALTRMYRAITHNLANVDTTGFKRRRVSFEEILGSQAGAAVSPGGRVESHAVLDFTQGTIRRTDRALDLALDGEGFFVIETAQGPRYTRNGAFRADAAGQLVDAAGQILAGEAGPIVLPPAAGTEGVRVRRDGAVIAAGQTIGQLRLVRFAAPEQLVPEGSSRFRAPEGVEPDDAENVTVHQGFREDANVNLVQELVNLLAVTRLYEANHKAAQMQDRTQKSLLDVAMA